MELRQLRYFVAIVDGGSLSRAAATIHVVQPALSQQMTQLEDELGVLLLQRSVRGVTPTPAGVALYRHAQQILKLAADTRDVVGRSDGGLSGRVKLGIPSSIALVLVGPLIAALAARFPAIVLEVYENPSGFLSAHLLNERVDLSVLVDDTMLPGIEATPLVDEALCFIQPATTPLVACGDTVALKDLAGVPLVLTTHMTTLRALVDRALAEAGVTPVIRAEASSVHTVLAIVAQGAAGTLMIPSALASSPVAGLLKATVTDPRIVRRVSLAHSRLNELSPAAACVHALIRGVASELLQAGTWEGEPALSATRD